MTRLPSRPVQTLDEAPSYVELSDGRLEVTLIRKKKQTTFIVSRISSEIGGVAMHWERVGEGDSYDVLLHPRDSHCDCAGFCYTSGCRHLTAAQDMQEAGALEGLT